MDASEFSRLLAKGLILWKERIDGGCCRSGRIDSVGRRRFAGHLSDRFPEASGLSGADVDAAFDALLIRRKTLVDWYCVLIEQPGTEIHWHGGRPVIAPHAIGTWEKLLNDFDPDSLLTLDLACRYGMGKRLGDMEQLTRWQTLSRVGDHELAVLWSRGLSDLHVHVGGVRIPQATWITFVGDRTGLRVRQALHDVYKDQERNLAEDIEEATSVRDELIRRTRTSVESAGLRQSTRKQWWRWSQNALAQERRMLVAAWSRACEDDSDQDAIMRLLDIYLTHKNRFFHLVRQPGFAAVPPGLRHFDMRYFSALKTKSNMEKWRALRRSGPRRAKSDDKAVSLRHVAAQSYGTSPRLEMAPIGDACQYLMESNDLRRVELRIVPFERPAHYFRFFKLWFCLRDQINRELHARRIEAPDIRFAVHFKRTRDRTLQQDAGEGTSDAARKLRGLDRDTVALRVALSSTRPRERKLMTALARIDVAGQERDTPLALFAPHLRLLRGEPDTIEFLKHIDARDPLAQWLRRWRALASQDRHQPSLGAPRLGMTLHAGEDFADLLDGLYQMGAAVEIFDLQAGDGIGHGLALTSGPRKLLTIRRGASLDSLCWLLHFVQGHDRAGRHIHACGPLRRAIKRAASELYRDQSLDVRRAEADDHVWAWRQAVMPRRAEREAATDLQTELIALNQTNLILHRREVTASDDPGRRDLDDLVGWAQCTLLEHIQEKRIIIEMNPSSNLRISGSRTAKDSPAVMLFDAVARGLLACVNTDNPGVFASCIENEYALLLRGACDAKMKEGEARDLLEAVRRIGMEVVYWPKLDPGDAWHPADTSRHDQPELLA